MQAYRAAASSSRRWWLGGGVLFAALAFVYRARTPEPAALKVAYWLFVRKEAGGESRFSPATATFQAGSQFRLQFLSSTPARLYLLNDGPGPERAMRLFHLGSLALPGGQPATSGWFVFDEHAGAEQVWLVMAQHAIPALESLPKGEVADPAAAAQIRKSLQWWKAKRQGGSVPEGTPVALQGDAAGFAEMLELNHK